MNIERVNAAKPTRWVTLLGIVLVPVLLAGGLVWGNWNADTRAVEAAIVNLDEPVTINDEYIPLGRQLTAALVDSDRVENLTWELASEADARAGLASGTYAAMVVIPEEFSAAATSYSGEASDAVRATIRVETSPVAGIADATLGKVVAQEAAQVLNETLTSAYLDQIYIGFNDLGEQFVTIADGAAELADGAEQLADGIGEAADGSDQLADGVGQLADGLDTMADQTAPLPSNVRKLANGTRDLSEGVGTYVDGVNQLVDQTLDSLDQQVELVNGVTQLAQGAAGVSGGIATYQQGLTANASQADQTADALTSALGSAPQQAAGIIAQACPDLDAQDLAVSGPTCVVILRTTAGTLQAAAAGLSQKDPQTGQSLASGAQQLAGGLDQLATELGSAGGGDSETKLKQLKAGGKKLAAGAEELAKGTDKLADGIPSLVDGIAQVADGASQLADGSRDLADGLAEAADGSGELADGARTLADGLAEGKDQLPSYTESERTNLADVVAGPVSTANLTGTAGLGAGWVTLLMMLGLWAGALATYLVIRALSTSLLGSAKSSARLVTEALVPGLLIALVQGAAVLVIGQWALGLTAGKLALAGAVTLLAAVTFMAVNHALVAWLGNVGRLVSLGLAVITAASALTSAAPQFFGALRTFSPLTPGLDALRAVVTESGAVATNVFVLLAWLLVAVGASAIAVVRNRTTSFTALLEAHGVTA